MNEKLKPGDLLVMNDKGQIEKADGTCEPFAIYEDVGMAIRYGTGVVKVILDERFCSYCKISDYTHDQMVWGKGMIEHPFFNNNLEYLEWLDATHESNNILDPKQ